MRDTKTDYTVDINWLCLYLVIFSIPIIEILALYTRVPASLTPPSSSGILVFAIIMTCCGSTRNIGINENLNPLVILWLSVCTVMIFVFAGAESHALRFFEGVMKVLLTNLIVAGFLLFLTTYSVKYAYLKSFFAGATALLWGAALVHGMLLQTIVELPYVYDPVLYRIQSLLHVNFRGFFSDIYNFNATATWLFYWIYSLLNVAIIFIFASEFRHAPNASRTTLILQFLVTALIGFGLYYLMPALAPAAFFGNAYPNHMPDPATLPRAAVMAPNNAPVFSPRNTMPSLHATWAILGLLALRRSPVLHKALGVMFVLSVLVVTLGAGQHYAVDWIAALPLVLLVRGICSISLPLAGVRIAAVASGTVLILLWVLIIRGASFSLGYPNLIKGTAIASIFVALWLENWLARAEYLVEQDGFYEASAEVMNTG